MLNISNIGIKEEISELRLFKTTYKYIQTSGQLITFFYIKLSN